MNILYKPLLATRLFISVFVFMAITFFMACQHDDDPQEEVKPEPPTLAGFSPASGLVGAKITITGTNFTSEVSENVVHFNGKVAVVNSASPTTLNVTVPEGATSGKITITLKDTTITSVNDFMVSAVYMAGYDGNTAKYWKNGVVTNLTDGTSSAMANAIFVSGNDVYVAGRANGTGTVWKNGTPTPTGGSTLHSIYVSGSDVYVAGTDGYWKNGVLGTLTATNQVEAKSIYVLGNDIYVAGRESNGSKYVAKYWKNGVPIDLSNGSAHALASAITVSGTDVYVAGNDGKVAKVWKNGVATDLTNGSEFGVANTIFVSGTDVYIGGSDGNIAKVWKNGIATDYTDGPARSSINSVVVEAGIVYAVGFDLEISADLAKQWINGKETVFSDGTAEGRLNAILIK